jgi:hypothetical protein
MQFALVGGDSRGFPNRLKLQISLFFLELSELVEDRPTGCAQLIADAGKVLGELTLGVFH